MNRAFLYRQIYSAALIAVVVGQGTMSLAGTTGAINGRVTDPNGSPLANVHVSAVSPADTARTATGTNGFYAFTGLPPDTYTLDFADEGFITQTVPGITVTQDQTYVANVVLQRDVRTLGRVAVRGSTALVQPTQTVNQYQVTSQFVAEVVGTPQNISETAALDALPGITTDSSGYPTVRGGAENDEGFELEGIDATEPISGQFINSLSLNGVGRLQLSTGGYDVSEGNTNSGVVNVVSKRGTFPGSGEATAVIGNPSFEHRLAFDYGTATPDNRFSFYYSFSGLRQNDIGGDGTTFYPLLTGGTSYDSGNDNAVNFYYHWGGGGQNELQYYADFGSNLFVGAYQLNIAQLPYASANGFVQLVGGLGSGLFSNPNASLIDFAPTFPTQAGLNQMINYGDNESEVHQVQKLNFKRQFSPSSFGEVAVYRTQSNVDFLNPWGGGAFGDGYEMNGSDNRGVQFDYHNQLSSSHELSFGGDMRFTKPNGTLAGVSSALFTDPLECGLPCDFFGLTSVVNPNAPATYVQRLYNQIEGPLGLPPASVPLYQIPSNASNVTDDTHRTNLWIKDRWQPNSRWTATYGVRWDQQVLDLPSDANELNMFYFTQGNCNAVAGSLASCAFFDQPGQAIGNNVTRPSFVSPRVAVAYQLGAHDVFRGSYGRFIEFTPISNIEDTYNVEASAAGCTIVNGCFAPLPGYSPTCINGIDPSHGGVRCNGINNLHQQIIEDLNTNNFAQYTPVEPQLATSIDFSWEHDFGSGLQLRLTPYYRKGTNYVVASMPLLFNLPNGQSVFGSPRESNAGINENTGIEFALDRNVTYGLSGFIHATYDNTIANYDSDFFPSVNQAAVDAGHFYHVSYVSPVTASGNLSYNSRQGFHFYVNVPFTSGYYYGVGTKTFVFVNGVPTQVLNTDIAEGVLGHNAQQDAYYFTDPTNPGTLLRPNIIASRGTPEGSDPGSLTGPPIAYLNLTAAQDVHAAHSVFQAGVTWFNVFGNYSILTPVNNFLFRPQGLGSYAPGSGIQPPVLPGVPIGSLEPAQPNFGPFGYENEPAGAPRALNLFFNWKY